MDASPVPSASAATVAAALSDDVIAAIATAPGRAAVAMLRWGGPRAADVAARCLTPWPLPPRTAVRATLHDADGTVVDDGLVTWFPAPRSFTGEDTVEFSGHGGTVAPERALAAVIAAGARLAAPGEFTRRAVLHGKLDLLQAEALGAMIDAPTRALHEAARVQVSGALSTRLTALRDALLDGEALLAYDIDFPTEDDGPVPPARVTAAVDAALASLDALLATVPAVRVAREGGVVVLAGAPNSGKSSLFNALLGEQRALVTDIAGTTRDAIDALVEAEPLPWRLVDTAGLRDSDDPLERLGIEVSHQWLARADVLLLCAEDDAAHTVLAEGLRSRTMATMVAVRTKADLAGPSAAPVEMSVDASTPQAAAPSPACAVSATTGAGLPALRAAISAALAARYPMPRETPLLLAARQQQAVTVAAAELAAFRRAWVTASLPASVAAVHLRAAVEALESLIGAVDREEVLGRVFAGFCVGK
jgi:tRNA modification GTPase